MRKAFVAMAAMLLLAMTTACSNVSGTVTSGGVGLSDVIIKVTKTEDGSFCVAKLTDANGNYSYISGSGNFTITPIKTGYTFSPASINITVDNVDVPAQNFTATAVTWSQSDLEGTWNLTVLAAGGSGGWLRARFLLDSAGNVTCLSFSESNGTTACPSPLDLRMTISSTGVISQSGYNANSHGHMTMTSNKNFAAGTGDTGSPTRYQLYTMQKEVAGTIYSDADLQNKSFVYHTLKVGAVNAWNYGTVSTDSARVMTNTSDTDPNGTRVVGAIGTMSVDANGLVTISGTGMETYQGFLSSDKKTIVGTMNQSGTYAMMILQVLGQTYTAGPVFGSATAHWLGCGYLNFWTHYTAMANENGVFSFSDWISSSSSINGPPSTITGVLSATGTYTVTEIPSVHGQMSHDGKFIVFTQTNNPTSGIYSLAVSIR